ncbi:MAG: hypothetical protein QOF89_2213 [Acidobacteriota bacterium]|jgi:uncharacterized damage-inducible protein DinB|nr:hypothetical protein [Acidobacteriota bacterium]
MNELERFLASWETEAEKTASLMRALPADQYDFRPDPGGRSIGELAWHLAEGDAYNSLGIESGGFEFDMKPPGIERPRTIAELAPGYESIHADAKARLRNLRPEDLDRKLKFFDGSDWTIRDILWNSMLLHMAHHRGQLAMLCRQAGGVSPGMYGPNREEMAALRATAAT